jgi:hypothetical protein
MTDIDNMPATPKGARPWVRMLRLNLSGLAILFIVAATAGYTVGHLESDPGVTWALVSVWLLASAAVGALLVPISRDVRALDIFTRNMPRRERASVRLIGIAVLAGCVAGGVIGVSGAMSDDGANWFIGNGNVPPSIAIIGSVLLLTVTPWFSLRWWREIDEHEKSAYTEGGNLAAHFVLIAGMVWWLLSRAALVPQPDVMVLVIAMSFVWTGVWLRRKYV